MIGKKLLFNELQRLFEAIIQTGFGHFIDYVMITKILPLECLVS